MNWRQEAHERAHYLQCYRRARDGGFPTLAQVIYEFYAKRWPEEVTDWAVVLGGRVNSG